jgi:dienelactone hydrolase
MNYRSAAVFRKKNIGLDQSEQLQSQALAENRGMKDFADDHGDPENHTDTALPPASARAGKKSVFDPPQSGFGAKGPYFVRENTYPHPSGASGDLYCCMPQGIRKKIPVVLFAPELLASGGKYKELLRHIASRGYAVVSSTYRYGLFVNDVERYSALMEGFDGVLELIKPLIDTARIGFVGHSYGAGALPAVAWHYRKELGWGSGGAFCFLMGPSYVHCMRQIQFEQFPSDVKLLIEVYENDHWNDFRIAEDVFYAINIHPADKDFIIVNKSKHGEWEINPDYQSPFCEDSSKLGPVQRHAVFRLVDALAAYAFDGDACGRDAALGNGCPRQTSMGHWPDGARVLPLTSTDVPIARNRLWPHALTATGFPRLVNWFLPFPFSCDFDDDRNERREFLTP